MDVRLIKVNRKKTHLGGFVVQASRHILILMLFSVLVTGMITGSIFVKNNIELYNTVSQIFQNHILSVSEEAFINIFIRTTIVNLSCTAALFFFGMCALGVPLPVFFTLIKGLGIGAFSSFMYSEYAMKGFGYCMLIFYPVQIIECMIVLKSGKESFSMSSDLFRMLTGKKQINNEEHSVRVYIIKFIVLSVIQLFSAAVSTLLTIYLIPLLKF